MHSIIIYTEGGFNLGLGNVYRMLELARSLKNARQNLQITFVTCSEDYVAELIRSGGFCVNSSRQDELINTIIQNDFNILIIDKLNIDENFLQILKRRKNEQFRTVLFGNISSANRLADLVINAVIGTDFSNNSYTDMFETRYLTGPKYLTLRSDFKYMAYCHQYALKNVLLLFGGTDQANFSCRILGDLLQSSDQYNITVVVGKGYRFFNELELIAKGRTNVKILHDILNVSDIMLKQDFLLTSPGTAMFEGFYLGLPCIGLFQNDSQKEVFRDFFLTKSYEDINNIVTCIQSIYDNIEYYHGGLIEMEIGQGKQDIINHIIELI